MDRKRILISGGGIAGLTLAIELKRNGFEPLVIEREPSPRGEGYMMDFFGTGWDVAERMGLTDRLRDVRYPIDVLEFVDADGTPYVHTPIERVRHALGGKYVYLRRGDLEAILADRARELKVEIRYATSLAALEDRGTCVHAQFDGGGEDDFALVVGADGVHSRVRELEFGPERQFDRFLGLYVAAFHIARGSLPFDRKVKIYQETDRMMFLYPLDADAARHNLRLPPRRGAGRERPSLRILKRANPRRRLADAGRACRLYRRGADLFRQRDADRYAAMAQRPRRADRRRLRLSHAARRPRLAYGHGGRLRAGAGAGAAAGSCQRPLPPISRF